MSIGGFIRGFVLLLALAPGARATDIAWPPGTSEVALPFRLVNNHIYLDMALNGHAPEPFIFDTGAVLILDQAHATALGIAAAATVPNQGFAGGLAFAGAARLASADLGGLAFAGQDVEIMNLAGLAAAEGENVAGLIGYQALERAVVIIDYAARRIHFIKPAAFRPPADTTVFALDFEQQIPVVDAMIDGIAGRFEIDTGSRNTLTLNSDFAEAHGLLEKYHPTFDAVTGYGVAGATHALIARAGRFTMGTIGVDRAVIGIESAGGQPGIAGTIGGGLLRRFTVTLDYGTRRLYLAPNGDNAPDLFDRAGLFLVRTDSHFFSVDDVIAGSPAAQAGVLPGDVIIAIDGIAVSSLTIAAARDRLKGPPGTIVRLTLGGRARRDISLVLADLV